MRTGTFVNQLSQDSKYTAFIPNKLPFEIKVDADLQNLLSKADLALGRLDGVADILPDVNFFILMYLRKEATLSSQIEGTQATFVDVLKAEAKIEDSEIHKDVDEILNYIRTLNFGIDKSQQLPLSLRLMREMHRNLLKGVRGETKSPGDFRTSQNWVGGVSIQTAAYVPPPHAYVVDLMGNIEDYLHDKSPIPVLIKTGLVHAQFETIHPFLDGNGRMGRLFITYYLCEQGILREPLLYLSDFFKRHKSIYYDKLTDYRQKDDIEGWLKFFLEGVIETSQSAVETARKIIKLREESYNKIASMGRSSEKGMMLLKKLFQMPMIRVKDIEQITTLENPNALVLLSKFVSKGILYEITGKQRNRVYTFRDYIDIFNP
ncbi:Fic family protein [Candidatus Microgenomates bacterium]|nr:MAG: Fic family protein [Candidatus Microgenomates bacterium]